jgi:hypothetical protein
MQELLQELMSAIAIAESRPEIDTPPECPTGAAVASRVQRLPAGVSELRSRSRGDLVIGIESVEMGRVPMARLRLGIGLEPLL